MGLQGQMNTRTGLEIGLVSPDRVGYSLPVAKVQSAKVMVSADVLAVITIVTIRPMPIRAMFMS